MPEDLDLIETVFSQADHSFIKNIVEEDHIIALKAHLRYELVTLRNRTYTEGVARRAADDAAVAFQHQIEQENPQFSRNDPMHGQFQQNQSQQELCTPRLPNATAHRQQWGPASVPRGNGQYMPGAPGGSNPGSNGYGPQSHQFQGAQGHPFQNHRGMVSPQGGPMAQPYRQSDQRSGPPPPVQTIRYETFMDNQRAMSSAYPHGHVRQQQNLGHNQHQPHYQHQNRARAYSTSTDRGGRDYQRGSFHSNPDNHNNYSPRKGFANNRYNGSGYSNDRFEGRDRRNSRASMTSPPTQNGMHHLFLSFRLLSHAT